MPQMRIGIAGAGAMGTALAHILASHNREVLLWGRDTRLLQTIQETHENPRYLPGLYLHPAIQVTPSFTTFLRQIDVLIFAIPSGGLHTFLQQNASILRAFSGPVIHLAKGLTPQGQVLSQMLQEVFTPEQVYTLKGPSFAMELARAIPTGFTLAGPADRAQPLLALFDLPFLTLEFTDCLMGVDWLSVLKNAYAIALGIIDALWGTANTRYLALTHIARELLMFLKICQLPQSLLFTYAGLGDLTLTGLTDLSRNRTFGLVIGKGFLAGTASMQQPPMPVLEGLTTLKILAETQPSWLNALPVLQVLVQFLGKHPKDAVNVREQIARVLLFRPLPLERIAQG